MARVSSISRLPPEIRDLIGRLREQGRTLDDIVAHLRQLEATVSRSALGRHMKKLDAMGKQLRRSREIAETLVRRYGDASGNTVAQANIQIMHSFINDVLMNAAEDEDSDQKSDLVAQPKAAALFAEAIERLTKASRHDLEFVAKIEARAAEKTRREAAKAAEAVGRAHGFTRQTTDAVKAAILGLRTP